MRLPQDTENWTVAHFDKAMALAHKRFDEYEARVDFTWPRERQDRLYRPYQLARQQAVDVGAVLGPYFKRQADALP